MKSGIYLITCRPPGRLPLYYVGKSCDINRRKLEHFGALRREAHCNDHIQRAYLKYGYESFSFEILELADEDRLSELEQFWLDAMVGYDRCFNKSLDSEATARGLRRSTETIKKMSAAKIGRKHTEETRRFISQIQLGKKRGPHSEATRRKIGASQVGEKNHAYGKVGAAHHRMHASRCCVRSHWGSPAI